MPADAGFINLCRKAKSHTTTMTIVSTKQESSLSLVDQLCGQTPAIAKQIQQVIGVALQKNHEATYFKYKGDKKIEPMRSNVLQNVRIVGLSVANNVYDGSGYTGDKLNVFIEDQQGNTFLITSGIGTWWSRSMITAIQGLIESDSKNSLLCISSYYKNNVCFANIYNNNQRVTSDEAFTLFNNINKKYKMMKQPLSASLKNMRTEEVEAAVRERVAILSEALTGLPVHGNNSFKSSELEIEDEPNYENF